MVLFLFDYNNKYTIDIVLSMCKICVEHSINCFLLFQLTVENYTESFCRRTNLRS